MVCSYSIDILLLSQVNFFVNYPNGVKLLLLLEQVWYGAFYGYFNVCIITIYSKLCDNKIETIMIALFTGIYNIATVLSSWLGDQYYLVYLRILSNLGQELNYQYFWLFVLIFSIVVPIIVLNFSLLLIPKGKKETDELL